MEAASSSNCLLDSEKQSLLEQLPQDTNFFTLDWAMKFVPIRYLDEQNSYGKRDISWHIAVAFIQLVSPERKRK